MEYILKEKSIMKEAETFSKTIGEIVAQDFRTASVFSEAGIDFCCGGKMTLEEACAEKGINVSDMITKLENPESAAAPAHKFNEWRPGFLCDYIVNEHHSYVRRSLPELVFYTRKIAGVHGANHPELSEIADLIEVINNELLLHLNEEEEVLFPAIKKLFGSNSAEPDIKNIISSLIGEHESAGGAMDSINAMTDGYKLPADACNSYRMTFELLKKFEDDLHVHVHLENNILFPKTMNKLN